MKLQLVSRNIDMQEENVKEKIEDNLSIQYTTYALAIDGKNKTYVSNQEEAQDILDNIKKEYKEKYTENLSIIQVYSTDYSEIASVNEDDAKKIITTEVKKVKEKDEKAIRLAKAKKTSQSTASVVKKSDNVNGVKFTVKPVSGVITSRFGRRSSPGGIGSTNHKGLDIGAQKGTPIKAVASGTVTFAGTKGELGKLVIIDHGNGVQTYYGHCSELYVSSGAKVEAGSTIAAVGKTGSATGCHLHFEVHLNGTAVNPQKYIY